MSERARIRGQQRAAELEAALKPAPEAHTRPEVVVVRLRRHGRALIIPAVLFLAVGFAAGFLIGSFEEPWQNWLAAAVAVLILLTGVLLPLSIWLGNTTTITTKRIIVRRGLLTRTRSEVPLSRVREIRTRASVFQRPFKTATIQLLVGSEQPVELIDVPGVNGIVDLLHELLDRTFSSEQQSAAALGATGGFGSTGGFGATGNLATTSILPGETRVFETNEGF